MPLRILAVIPALLLAVTSLAAQDSLKITDETRFKYLLAHAQPSARLNARMLLHVIGTHRLSKSCRFAHLSGHCRLVVAEAQYSNEHGAAQDSHRTSESSPPHEPD
jgi:hypothetical protein